jgi:hypothetical protein
MVKKALLIVLGCFTHYLISQSLTEIEHHKKYWYYKSRFNNDFINVGLNQGQSIPFNQRQLYGQGGDILKAGDATVQLGMYIGVLATEYRLLKDKGQYDALKIVKHELFCALDAFNRLDYNAESTIGAHPHPANPKSALGPNLNGFFIRDDIPPNFVENHYKELNYYNDGIVNGVPNNLINDKGFTQLYPKGQIVTESSYQSFITKSIAAGNTTDWNNNFLKSFEESQDQLYYLLMGTALVSKLVDAGDTDGSNVFGYGSGQSDLRQEAINISDRLIKHAGANPLWNIRNPANGNAFVQVGASALVHSYALDNAGCFIKYGQDFPSFILGYYPFNACTDYRNLASATPVAWNGLLAVNGGNTPDLQGFYHALAAVCNCNLEVRNYTNLIIQAAITSAIAALNNAIGGIQNQINNLPWWAQSIATVLYNVISTLINLTNVIISGLNYIVNQLFTQLLSPVKVNTTEERLIYNNYLNAVTYDYCVSPNTTVATHIGSKEYFGIFLNRVLHPNPSPLPNWLQALTNPITTISYLATKQDLHNILSSAPCEGNYNFYPTARPGSEWGAPNRLDRPDPIYRYSHGCLPNAFLGEYNGLDYMLLHNLYYLAEGTASFSNYIERKVTTNLPMGNYFTSTNKNTLGAYEYLTAQNTVNSNAAAYYRAGKEIALLPSTTGNGGFSAVLGSDFDAKIDRYTCGGSTANGDEMLRTNASNTNTTEYNGPVTKEPSVKKQVKAQTALPSEESIAQELENFKAQLDAITKLPDYRVQDLISKIEVYPNPNNGNFNLAFNLGNNDNVNVDILDATGRIVFSQRHIVGFVTIPLDFTHLAKGIYLAKFENTNGELLTKKITIN